MWHVIQLKVTSKQLKLRWNVQSDVIGKKFSLSVIRPDARTQNVTKAEPVKLNFFTLDRNVGEFVTFSDSCMQKGNNDKHFVLAFLVHAS